MPCRLICPNLRCRKILKVPEETRGKVVRVPVLPDDAPRPAAPQRGDGPRRRVPG